MLNTLYHDLVRGIRKQRNLLRKQSSVESKKESKREYEVMLRAVLADGLVRALTHALALVRACAGARS